MTETKPTTYIKKLRGEAAKRAKLAEIRNDPNQTQARYDEIIRLRMFILDFQDDIERNQDLGTVVLDANRWTSKIERFQARWGRKGDCV